MRIVVAAVGKTTENYIAEGTAMYSRRIARYVPFSAEEWPDKKGSALLPATEVKKREGEIVLHHTRAADAVVLLDERGVNYDSEGFARFLQQKMNMGVRQLVFVIGGSYGFSEEVYNRFPERISLSRMTFTHQMVRLFVTEQIYRAFTILRGEPYHHT